jgi:hypothetical protein
MRFCGLPLKKRNILDRESARSNSSAKGDQAVNNMRTHNVRLNIQQQTFNTYMWSRGFNYQPATGKMW